MLPTKKCHYKEVYYCNYGKATTTTTFAIKIIKPFCYKIEHINVYLYNYNIRNTQLFIAHTAKILETRLSL